MGKEPDKEPKDEWIVEVGICGESMTFTVQKIYTIGKDGMNLALANIPFITVEAKDEIGAFNTARGKLHCLGLNPVA